ncbi:MAG: lipopolysaccharide heptosyltransferase II [Thermoguttaceae bacterium]
MNIGIFLPNWLGDLVMATPALRALRRHFGPQARLTGILRPHLGELLSGTGWLDEQWYFDPRSKEPDQRRRALLRRMRQQPFDKVLLLTNSLHTALLAWLGGAKERIGYVRNGRGVLLTGKVEPPRQGRRILPTPMVQYYLDLARAAGCPTESPHLELAVTAAERRLGERIWRNLGLRRDGRVVAINASGAYGAAKQWPVEHCAELARLIAGRLDHDVLILCGPRECQQARDIVRLAQFPRVFSLASQPVGLAATKSCLERCRLLVSTDSGPRHVAAALGKPVVTLLGPTLPVWIENPTVAGVMVRLEMDCIGCGKRRCPLRHHRCMRDLAPQRVLEELSGLLERQTVKAA